MTEARAPFPAGGRHWEDLQAEMRGRTARDLDWKNGRTPLFVFKNDDETYQIGKNAFMEFFSENALGRERAFFSIGSMEKEVLDYGLSMLSAPESGGGVFTTGGSESIFVAMKVARDAWRAKHPNAAPGARLNAVVPITAHPAFDKAADAMDIELRRGPLRADKRADVAALKPLIDGNTMALLGSAPCFPHGVIDPIDELSALALETGVWLHVDACVGGWIAPWFTKIGRPTPHFDFRFPGVRSISADLHKFGFCPKPASTVFFRDIEDRERGKFVAEAWPSGKFATSTIAGSRPGGAVAAAWAVLNHLGESGFMTAATKLAAMTDAYKAGLTDLGLTFWAEPDVTIINYGSNEFDVFHAAVEMHRKGWLPGLTRRPKGLHAMMSLMHAPSREDYLRDLGEAVEIAKTLEPGTSMIEAVYN